MRVGRGVARGQSDNQMVQKKLTNGLNPETSSFVELIEARTMAR
jgi:hypothetical protein